MEKHLLALKQHLLSCNYPENIINIAFHNARLQGPAPEPADPKNTIPFVSTNYADINYLPLRKKIESLLTTTRNNELKEIFKDTRVILGLRQPKILLHLLSKSKFSSNKTAIDIKRGLYKCNNKKCLLCKLYIQECKSFVTSNKKVWNIKSNITCNSRNVIYYLMCNMCNDSETYIGKTNNLRLRTNNHITGCRCGNGPNIFGNHVFHCGRNNNCHEEPFFKVYAFTTLQEESKLQLHEKHLQHENYDTMNCY